ncbi:hypothetical protein BD414DRAFT_525240 [Trametes punicea]|nr:hypothetical protein BD414DRAFT_525240 [Trametes punicea]
MFSSLLSVALLLLLCATTTKAIPLYDGSTLDGTPLSPVSPLAVAMSLLPLPLLAALKYAYMRFRRGQSIHAHACPLSPNLEKTMSPRSPTEGQSSSGLWYSLTPYLVGCLGSPEWETKICSRLDRTLRQAKAGSRRSSRRSSPALADSSATTANTSTAYYSSLSNKSRSRSKSMSASLGDVSMNYNSQGTFFTSRALSAITDCAIIHPSSPPCLHAVPLPVPPEPAHKSSRTSIQELSPTLMQMMEPVLASWCEDSLSKGKPTSSSADTSRNKSNSSTESRSSFQTPMTSPASPAITGTFPDSTSTVPFTLLRKQFGVSATSSILSVTAATLPSPTSVSLAVFHSPIASGIPVPQPVYTPTIRPESCAVLPFDWRNERDCLRVHAILQSPTHRSPAPGTPVGIFDVFASAGADVSFSPTLAPAASPTVSQGPVSAGPVVLKSALKKRTSGSAARAGTSPPIPFSLRNSVSFSVMSLEVPAADCDDGGEKSCRKSWDLADLMSDGQLDVDAVTRVLGLGLGLPLPTSRSSVGSVGSDAVLSLTDEHGEAGVGEGEYDVEQYATGWGSPRLEAMRASMQLLTHVHGAPLCVIPEESRSEVCSVSGSVHVVDAFLVGAGEEGGCEADASMRPGHESWREGESLMTLNVGVAW